MKYTFFLLVIYGLVTYFNEYNNLASNNSLGINIRLFLPFSDEAKLGSYFVRLYGLFLALYFVKEKNKFENFSFFSLTLAISIVILLSGERTSLFFMILFIFFA